MPTIISVLASNPGLPLAWLLDEGRLFHGNLDDASHRILMDEFREAQERRLAVVAQVLSLMCDSRECLDLAKSRLQENHRELRELGVLIDLLTLASLAAYYNDDETAFSAIRPYLHHDHVTVRYWAYLSLHRVPGDEAEQLFTETARDSPDGYSMETYEMLMTNRRRMMAVTKRVPPGRRQENVDRTGSGTDSFHGQADEHP